jgi:hypothetical protein
LNRSQNEVLKKGFFERISKGVLLNLINHTTVLVKKNIFTSVRKPLTLKAWRAVPDISLQKVGNWGGVWERQYPENIEN